MAASGRTSFSEGGEYLAQSSADGRLKLWETATNTLRQEFTPSSHLSATCSCICWAPLGHKNGSLRKKKKKKTEVEDSVRGLDLIAMGTYSGSILLYSVAKGDLQSEMTGGHEGKVMSICWHVESDSLYSGSQDDHIVQWSIQTGEVKNKWKCHQGSVTSICLSPDCSSLISANRNICWWDLSKHKVIKKFTGHATEISHILFVSYDANADSSYLITAANSDRFLQAWHLNKSSQGQNAIVSFVLPEEAIYIDTTSPSSREQSLLLLAISKYGVLYIFEHHLNGHCKKPLRPAVTMTIATSDREIPKPIPIVCAQIGCDINRHILFTYGNSWKLSFERLPYSSSEKQICLPRQDPSKIITTVESATPKIKQPERPFSAKTLGPGHLAPSAPTVDKTRKRKRDSSPSPSPSSNQLPMEERLSVLSLESSNAATSSSSVPRALNMSNLLIQGLQSKDSKIFSEVLGNPDEEIILNTVPRLPVEAIIPLLKELHKHFYNSSAINFSSIKWMRTILSVHTSFLLACSDLEPLLSSICQILEMRTSMFEKMSRLRGRTDIILSRLKSRRDKQFVLEQNETALVYDDDSSDDEIFDEIQNSDDNWDENENDDEDDEEEENEEEDMDSEDESDAEKTTDTEPLTDNSDDDGDDND